MTKFTNEGYGVILGEFGPQSMSKPGIPAFLRQVMLFGQEYGYVPVLWNNSYYNRTDALYEYSDIAEVYQEITGVEPPLEVGPDVTGVAGVTVVDDVDNMELVASWEGLWTRTNNVGVERDDSNKAIEDENGYYIAVDGEIGQFDPGTIFTSDDTKELKVDTNKFWWQIFLNYDWSSLKKPCLRITLADDSLSQSAGFQLGYTTQFDGGSYTMAEYANEEYGEKIFTLKDNKLAVKEWLVLSSATPGATITKIEIFDEK
jgi:hypothetical protein